jgi:hypothetical protein
MAARGRQDLPAQFPEPGRAHDPVHDARENLIGVDAHARQCEVKSKKLKVKNWECRAGFLLVLPPVLDLFALRKAVSDQPSAFRSS